MDEKRCILCNKPYDHNYVMFGRGCLENLYELLKISKPPRIIRNKEMYLCNRIAWRNSKFLIGKKKKYALAKKYIALNYLDRMNYDFLDDVKEKISKDINSISIFLRNIIDSISFSLNDVYQLFNYSQRFDEIMKQLENINFEDIDEKIAEKTLKSISFIFDVTKKTNPILYVGFYSMQYMFWQLVVAGGILADMKLSARLLLNALVQFKQEVKDLVITDDETINQIKESEEFKKKIKELIEKYGNGKEQFSTNNSDNTDCNIEFENKDLFLAIHGSSIHINAVKNQDNSWNMDIEISDIYDFTDFKSLKKYVKSNSSLIMSIFSTTLNNFAVVSSEYGVIKPYNLKIKFKIENYKN